MKQTGTKRKRILFIAILATVFFMALLHDSDEGIEVKVSHPTITSITETIPGNGKVGPVTEVHITPDVSGEIVEICCQEGDYVHRGELLVKIKPEVYLSVLDQANALLNSAKSQYQQHEASCDRAETSFRRSLALRQKNAISQSEYEEYLSQYLMAKGALEAAKYNIQSAEASVTEARENLEKTSIYAPMDGVVSRLYVEKGERVVGTTQMAGTEILSIADFSQMEVVLNINENDISKLEKGDSALIEIEAVKREDIRGVVTRIANSSSVPIYSFDRISTYEVRIQIIDSIDCLRPGMSANVNIETEKKDSIITLPIRCINSNGCIFVVRNGGTSVEMRRVVTGIQDINNIEILEGVGVEEEIVISPYDAINRTLTDNGKIFIDRDQY